MAPKYENFSKEELLRFIEKQEQELKQKKYGLVWDAEREPEQVVLDCENNLPVLKRVKGKEIKTSDQEDNILIEGDNYHALTVLNYTHKEKIDVIYIDPPYNRGNKDFLYNDIYVDKEDGYRHSKWLNFMEKRLNLAKELLKDTGVIFISIDDIEFSNLKLLCDKIFNNFCGVFVWQKKYGGGNDSGEIANEHEYILAYSKNSLKTEWLEPHTEEYLKRYSEEDEMGRFFWDTLERPGLNNPIKVVVNFERKKYNLLTFRSQKRVDEEIKNGEIRMIKIGVRVSFQFKQRLREGKKPRSILRDARQELDGDLALAFEKIGSNSSAKAELREIFNKDVFNNPKPTTLIQYLLLVSGIKKGIVLDFFAGSGTTGHALMKSNKDNVGLKFILCSNNENNICTEVCYPRLGKVIKGYKKNGNGEKVEGLGGNLQYFKTALVKKNESKEQMWLALTRECAEMLCVKESIYNFEKKGEDYQIYFSNKKDKYLGIYFNFLENSFLEFYTELKKIKEEKIIYVFSLSDEADKKPFKGIKNIEIKPIPDEIMEIYAKLVRLNIPLRADIIRYDLVRAKDDIFIKNDKDSGARKLRIVLEKTIKKIAQKNGHKIYKENNQDEKSAALNDLLKREKIISKVEWEENKTYMTIGNQAAHGEYGQYDLAQVKNFYKHAIKFIENNNITI